MTGDRAAPIHLDLDDRFYQQVEAALFPQHILRWRNDGAAAIGLASLDDAAWVDHFGRFTPLPGNIETPRAVITATSSAITTMNWATAASSCSPSFAPMTSVFWTSGPRGRARHRSRAGRRAPHAEGRSARNHGDGVAGRSASTHPRPYR